MEHASETLHAILGSIVDAIITIDGHGTILTVNAAVETLLGYRTAEVIGRNISKLLPDVIRDDEAAMAALLITHGPRSPHRRDVRAVRKGHEGVPVELTVGQVRGGDDPVFVVILRDVSDRVNAMDELHAHHGMIDAISRIQSQFILDGNVPDAFDALLDQIIDLTDSEYGFIGEIERQNDGTPYLRTHAITNIAWNDETRDFYEQNAPTGMEFFNLKTLFGTVITSGKPVVANDPRNDPRAGGLPPGHPALNAFLGLPFHIGERMVGMIGIANRPTGYDDAVIRRIDPLLATCGNLVGALESTRKRVQAEEALREANERLAVTVSEMTTRNEQVLLMSELEDLLQACETLEEAYAVVAHISKRLFPGMSGAIYELDDSNRRLNLINNWGPGHITHMFSSAQCIGIRRGRPHVSVGAETPLNCHHVDTASYASLCVPLIGKSETFGVLELLAAKSKEGERAVSGIRELAVTIARRIAVTFANLKLSQNLREQSLRDPLTNLYNRRHMNETLEREVHRARRDVNRKLSVIQFDLDRFKRINDEFGHGAGDIVLAEFAAILQDCSRGSDVACRLGGEEFLLVLPDCPREAAAKRAEEVRQRFAELVCATGGVELRDMSVSSGVATYPDCAASAAALLRVADEALYAAKASGRNRVEEAPVQRAREPSFTI